MKIKGVIFDLDGTLLDTLDGIIYTLNVIGAQYGKKFTKDDFLPLWGLSAQEILSKLFDTRDEKLVEELAKTWGIEFKKTLKLTNLVKPFQKTYEVLRELKNMGLRLGISTSTPREVLEMIMTKFDFTKYIEAYTSRDDVTRGKPDPEIFVKTCRKLGLKNSETIIVGDTRYDIIAGVRGGFITILIDHYNRYQRIEGLDPKPHAVVKSFDELLEVIRRWINE